ncbi:MAG: hypothetical protein AAF221_10085 [Pseudomonadota bacterium]
MAKRLLLVDDCPQITKLLTIIVERYFSDSIIFETAYSLKQAERCLEHMMPDIVLLDYRLQPYDDCRETLPALRRAGYAGPVHVWSTLDRSLLMAAKDCADAASTICKIDFQGLRLKSMIEGIMASQPSPISAFAKKQSDGDCRSAFA